MNPSRWSRDADVLDAWLEGKNMRRLEDRGGLDRSTLYEWRSGKRPTPCYAPRAIYPVYPDDNALAELMGLDDLGLGLYHLPTAGVVGDVREEMLEAGASLGAAMAELKSALADKVITEEERRAVRARLDDAIRELEETKQALEAPSLKAVGR
jgi:hypothetical protein